MLRGPSLETVVVYSTGPLGAARPVLFGRLSRCPVSTSHCLPTDRVTLAYQKQASLGIALGGKGQEIRSPEVKHELS